MGDGTAIEWTDMSWNPLRARNLKTDGVGHFCVKVSPGCKNCYAEIFQPRRKNPIRYAAQDRDLVELFLDEQALREPIGKTRPRLIFPCSMTDLFAEFYPDTWIDKVMAVAALTPQHTYQVLTKRADRLFTYMTNWPSGMARRHHVFTAVHNLLNAMAGKTGWSSTDPEFARAQDAMAVWPLPNWRQGVSVEDQSAALERIPFLMKTPAALRWISAEPLLEMIDVRPFLERDMRIGPKHTPSLDWVVVGGESGGKARPFHLEWAGSLVAQCAQAGVPIFVKQIGRRPRAYLEGGKVLPFKPKDPKGGDMEEWPVELRVRQQPEKPA